MKTFLRRFYDIREGEWWKTGLTFLYMFLIIASLTVVKPVRNSLFLTNLGAEKLPYAYILVAILATLTVTLYSRITLRFKLNQLVQMTTVFSITSFALFWTILPFSPNHPYFFYIFYVWVAIFATVSTSQVWLLANYVFNAREARRIFGFIGAGAISGGITGGYLTKYLAPLIGTRNMIFLSITFLVGCFLLLQVLWRQSAGISYKDKMARQKKLHREAREQRNLKLILKSKHLTSIAVVVGVGVVVANLVDFQYNAIAHESISDGDELTAFFGFWLSNLSVVSLLVQLFLTGRILTRWGVGWSLFFLPVGILTGAIGVLILPGLWSAVFMKVADGGLKHSINRSGIELLILPTPAMIKNQVKTFIDVFVDSLGTGLGGLLLIAFGIGFGFDLKIVTWITVGLIGIWLFFIRIAQKEYVNSFRHAIEKRILNLGEEVTNLQDASVFQTILRVLEGHNDRQIVYILDLLEDTNDPRLIPHLERLIRHPSGEIRIRVLQLLSRFPEPDLSELAREYVFQEEDLETKIGAMDYLIFRTPDPDSLLNEFLKSEDYRVGIAGLLCMAKWRNQNQDFAASINLKDRFESICERIGTLEKDDSECRCFIMSHGAQIIGLTRIPELYSYLHAMLGDDDPEVRRDAVIAAGLTREGEFVPLLIRNLRIRAVRKYAREALAEHGEAVLPALEERLSNPQEDRIIRLNVPRISALVGSQKSVDLLLRHLDEENHLLRYEVIKGLNKLRTHYPNLKFDQGQIRKKLLSEMKNLFTILVALGSERDTSHSSQRAESARRLLIQALQERLDQNLERIFRLLGLQYRPQDMWGAYRGIVSDNTDLRANAVEFLDNILDVDLKNQLLPLLDTRSLDDQIERARGWMHSGIPSETESLLILLEGTDGWLRACALHMVAESNNKECWPAIEKLKDSSDSLVRDTAVRTLQKLSAA